MRMRKRVRPEKRPSWDYEQIWRIVDGAVCDAFTAHPDYLSVKGATHKTARRSIVKRVTGAIIGYAEQSARGRSGEEPAAETGEVVDKGLSGL